MDLILASQSKGRAALLRAAGYCFRQIPSRVEEPEPPEGSHLERYVLELAVLKATAVAVQYPDSMVIGADTALIHDRHIIGKPETPAEARRMLARLGGRRHRISSAACIIIPATHKRAKPRVVKLVDTAYVVLRKWTPAQIRQHVTLTRPLAWAGAYAVQDPYSAAVVESIQGDLATVIGLPMKGLAKALRRCRMKKPQNIE